MKAIICFGITAALAFAQPAPPAPPALPALPADAAPAIALVPPVPPAPPADLAPVPPAPPPVPKVWTTGSADKFADFGRFAELGRFAEFGKFSELSAMDDALKMRLDKFEFAGKDPTWTQSLMSQSRMLDQAFQFQFQAGGGRSRAEEQADRQYERGMRSLDKRQWDEAVAQFEDAAAAGKGRADGAVYWKAYALMKLGRGKDATAALDELAKNHPQSRWLNDAKAMRVEIAQAGGRPVSPEDASDDDIKLMAINGLMNSDPERSIPLLEKILVNPSSPKLRERALFVLSQSDSAKAREVLVRIAKGGSNPDLQMMAVRALGMHGGKENRQTLAEVYSASTDLAVKRQILNSYMVSGERDRLLAAAKSDPAPELRGAAIRYLGNMGASAQLAALYGSESSSDIRAQIMQGLFVSGNSQKLIEIAKTEKDAALRERAIRHLGTMGSEQAGAALVEIYGANADVETRKKVLNALFIQGQAKPIIEVARKETNPELRRTAVQQLSNMHSKEATDFLMEILNK